MYIQPSLRASRGPRAGALAGACALLALAWTLDARAERADRTKELAITSTAAVADNTHRTAEFSGDVVVSQGTLEIHADRVQMRQGANGERLGFAYGKTGAPVRFRQHGDQPGEWNEGQADRVEYDSTANEVRLIGAASLRNLSGTLVTQQVYSDVITYDTARDTISSTRTEQRASPDKDSHPAPRVTVIFAPRAPSATDPASATAVPPAP